MLFRLFLLFILVPMVDMTLLFVMAELTHWWVSLGLVIVSGVIGSLLAHSQGLAVWEKVRKQLMGGQVPGDSLLDAGFILLAGGLLLTPGLLTDLFGISLLLPPSRNFFKTWLVAWFKSRYLTPSKSSQTNTGNGQSKVIDSYVVEDPAEEDTPESK